MSDYDNEINPGMPERAKKNVNELKKTVGGKTRTEAMGRLEQEAARIRTFGIQAYDKAVTGDDEHGWIGTLYYIDTGLGL